MTKVNNRKVIRRLAFRELRTNRKMNAVVILSIVLTCILFTALTSIGGSLLNGMQQETMRQVGGNRMAGLKWVLPEDYEKVLADNATCDVVYQIIVGQAVNEEFKEISAEVKCQGNEDAAEAMFCLPTTGRLPEKQDEIAVSTLILDELGLPYELGTKVPITLDRDGEITEHTFSLCGYWQGDKMAMAQQCLVSKDFADAYASVPTAPFYAQPSAYTGYYMVDFNFHNSWDIEGKTEKLLTRIYGDSGNFPSYGINWAYSTSNTDSETLAGGIMLILVIFAAGYLIIYNIFHINISSNIRRYGLLKTVGTTASQLRRMVRMQAVVYCAIGIPMGLILGLLLGRLLIGSIMKMMDVQAAASYAVNVKLLFLMCLIAAAFTFATVMISCHKPCKIAGRVSPIEALRYNDTNILSGQKSKKTAKVSPFTAAMSNMSRCRKKTMIVVLSLSLSLILVNTMFTVLRGIDLDRYVSSMIIGDFIIEQDKGSQNDEDTFQKITPEQIEILRQTDGVAEVDPVFFEWGRLQFSGQPLERLNALLSTYDLNDQDAAFESAREGELLADIYGISPELLRYFEPDQGSMDIQKFESGNYAIVMTEYIGAANGYSDNQFYEIGDTLTLSTWDGNTQDFEVMAICRMPIALDKKSYYTLGGQVIIPEKAYSELVSQPNAMNVLVNAADGRFEDVDNQVSKLIETYDSDLIVKSKRTYTEEYSDFLKMIKLVGGTLSGILALIGILNFVNAVVTGILSRKRELAMMNAIGMTGKQQSSMVMWEGIHYAALTAVCSVIISTVFSCTVVKMITGGLPYFTYHFTLLPLLICILVLMLLSAVIPAIAYKNICRESIVERLRVS